MQLDFIRNLNSVLKRQSPGLVLLTGTVLLALIYWLDIVTGPRIELTLFYLLPVCFVAWFSTEGMGHIMAVACSIATYMAEHEDPLFSPKIAYLNAASRLFFFFMVVAFIAAWKSAGFRLEAKVRDRTAKLKAETDEHSRARAAIRELASQLAAAEDDERRRLAYDIHDALGQMLSAVKLNISAVLSDLEGDESEKPRLKQRMTETMRFVDELIRQTRTLVFDLHPAMLDDLGLIPTIHWYTQEFGRRTGVEVTVSEQGDARSLGQITAHFLFRAVKELLNNALNHGRAREIIISLHWQSDVLRIVIDDDGSGFDSVAVLATRPRRGLGLAAITERMAALGGRFQIESRAAEGTRVILEAFLEPAVALMAST